jgi:hypothetical protein
VFVVGEWTDGFVLTAPTTAPLLHRHYLFVAGKVGIQDTCKFATVQQVSKGRYLSPKDAWTEANTGIVVVHFVLLLTGDQLSMQETHQMHHDFPIAGR